MAIRRAHWLRMGVTVVTHASISWLAHVACWRMRNGCAPLGWLKWRFGEVTGFSVSVVDERTTQSMRTSAPSKTPRRIGFWNIRFGPNQPRGGTALTRAENVEGVRRRRHKLRFLRPIDARRIRPVDVSRIKNIAERRVADANRNSITASDGSHEESCVADVVDVCAIYNEP